MRRTPGERRREKARLIIPLTWRKCNGCGELIRLEPMIAHYVPDELPERWCIDCVASRMKRDRLCAARVIE